MTTQRDVERESMEAEIARAERVAEAARPARCRACFVELARARRTDPGSFNHGLRCDACRKALNAIELVRLRATWKATNAYRKTIDQTTRSGVSLSKHWADRLAQIERYAAELKGT